MVVVIFGFGASVVATFLVVETSAAFVVVVEEVTGAGVVVVVVVPFVVVVVVVTCTSSMGTGFRIAGAASRLKIGSKTGLFGVASLDSGST